MRRSRNHRVRNCVLAAACLWVTACGASGGADPEASSEPRPTTARDTERDRDRERDDRNGDRDGTTTTEAERDRERDGTTTTAPNRVPEQQLRAEAGMTSEVSSSDTRYTSVGALVTNPNKTLAAYDAEVLFNLVGADGKILDSTSDTIQYIPPATTVPVSPIALGFDIDGAPESVDVIITADLREDEGWDGVEFLVGEGIVLQFADPAVRESPIGMELTAQITNPTGTVAEYGTWDCVLRRGGEIVGGEGGTLFESVPPGVTVALDALMSVDVQVDDFLCRATA